MDADTEVQPLSAEQVRNMFLDYCQAGKDLDVMSEMEGAWLAEILKMFLKSKALDLLTEHPREPCLYSYQQDASSYLCQATVSATTQDRKLFRRGKMLYEFLMERGLVVVSSRAGERKVALMIGQPRSLAEGKKTSNLSEHRAISF